MATCTHKYEMKTDGVTRQMHSTCGAYVCYICYDHETLVRCYCGWAKNGGDGVRQLLDMGENVEDEGYGYDEVFGLASSEWGY
jgi:hypothetical protein